MTEFIDYAGALLWDGTPVYVGDFESIHIQVVGTPSTPYQIQRSLTLAEWSPATLFDYNSAQFPDGSWVLESLAAAGMFTGTARGYFRFVTGAGSNVYLFACQRDATRPRS